MNAADEKPKPQFFRIGSSIVKDGAVKAMTAGDLKVFLVLSLHTNWTTGKCWPSYRTLHDLTGCSRTTIAAATRHLYQLGLISCRREKAHNGRRNVYVVFRTIQPPSGGQSSVTDYPPSDKSRNEKGRFQSSHTDDPRSRTTHDPQSSRTDQNEIYLNEINRTRSKETPPPPPTGGMPFQSSPLPSMTIVQPSRPGLQAVRP